MIYLLEAFGMHFVRKHRPVVFEMSTVISPCLPPTPVLGNLPLPETVLNGLELLGGLYQRS